MKRNRIRSIQVHYVPDENPVPLDVRFSAFRLRTIERSLNQSDLSISQKKEVLTGVLSKLNTDKSPELQST